MARLSQAAPEQYEPIFGRNASMRGQTYALRPEIAERFVAFGECLRDVRILPGRLLELVRLRIAYHNQCRSCMSVRYSYGVDDGLTEDLVCSLERPGDADDLTDAERAALSYADLMATNHLAVDDETFAELRKHLSDPEIMELCFNVAFNVGFGRMAMSLNMLEGLPQGYTGEGVVTPWGQPEVSVIGEWADDPR